MCYNIWQKPEAWGTTFLITVSHFCNSIDRIGSLYIHKLWVHSSLIPQKCNFINIRRYCISRVPITWSFLSAHALGQSVSCWLDIVLRSNLISWLYSLFLRLNPVMNTMLTPMLLLHSLFSIDCIKNLFKSSIQSLIT